jgi:hypothetical protein
MIGVEVLSRMVWRRTINLELLKQMGLSETEIERARRKQLISRIEEEGRRRWVKKLKNNDRLERYEKEKDIPHLEEYAKRGGEGAKVRMMCRGDSLTVRTNHIVRWKYGAEIGCGCGEEESERHVLLECPRYENHRREWLNECRKEKGEMDPMEGVLGYVDMSCTLEECVLKGAGAVWKERQRREKERS